MSIDVSLSKNVIVILAPAFRPPPQEIKRRRCRRELAVVLSYLKGCRLRQSQIFMRQQVRRLTRVNAHLSPTLRPPHRMESSAPSLQQKALAKVS